MKPVYCIDFIDLNDIEVVGSRMNYCNGKDRDLTTKKDLKKAMLYPVNPNVRGLLELQTNITAKSYKKYFEKCLRILLELSKCAILIFVERCNYFS